MSELILDPTVIHAEQRDCWPIQERGRPALPPCFDLALGSGLLKLTHAAMPEWVTVSTEHVRIAMPDAVNITLLRKALGTGGVLRSALVDLRWAAISDRGILTACGEVKKQLQSLAEQPGRRGTDHDDAEFHDPVMQPYDRWWYGVERNGNEASTDKPQVLAFPITHVNRARERNPNLIIEELYELLAEGLSPVMAKIGVPRHSSDFAAVRAEWIEIAIESLMANIEEAVKGWSVLPGEPFQNIVMIDDDMFIITLDTIDGVTVASATASKQALEEFSLEVHRVGHLHLARGLAMLHRAVVS
ncbi:MULTISPECIES: hypothetical protein [Bradyrhizobium]|nr:MULTISPECIES: hypothetical protein [Bradyrhizobium]KQT12620.1 hypothetical protein ASG57_06470 [Bradyrhizobium sp. Leaf396]